jgi:hypothetical protein
MLSRGGSMKLGHFVVFQVSNILRVVAEVEKVQIYIYKLGNPDAVSLEHAIAIDCSHVDE